MRPIILVLIALVSFQPAFAQKIEIGLNSGVGLNSAPLDNYNNHLFFGPDKHTSAPGATPAASLSIAYNRHKWQVGISISAQQISYSESGTMFIPVDHVLPSYIQTVKYTIANPAIPANIFINRKVNFRKLSFFGGIYGGYVTGYNSVATNDYLFHRVNMMPNNTGYDYGFQVGGAYYITKHFGFAGQLAAGRMHFSISDASTTFNTFTGTLGIRYRL